MSAQPNLMTPGQAYDVLVAQIHAPVFFEKLARDYGITPSTQAAAQELLELAVELRTLHETQTVKAASAQDQFIAQAKRELQHVMQQSGYRPPQPSRYKEAAAQCAQVPVLQEAAYVWQNYLAQQAR